MKTYLKTICIGKFYYYCLYKVVDAVGRTYYLAEPVLHGVTRIADTEQKVKDILEQDVSKINKIQQKIR